jgi:glycine cleavage system aminomethyltransferase T
MDHFEPVLTDAVARVPLLETAGISLFFNGPESFTPDNRYYLGEAPFRRASTSPAASTPSASSRRAAPARCWPSGSRPVMRPIDMADVDVRRAQPFQTSRAISTTAPPRAWASSMPCTGPIARSRRRAGCPALAVPRRLVALGACMGEAAGWERPNWFAPEGVEPAYDYSFGRQNWFPYAQAEAEALRDHVALFDLTSFAKFRVEGRDACAVLDRVSANAIDVEPGRIVYTQWLNERGGIEADLTVTRLSDSTFLVVTAGASQIRDFAWLKRHIPDDAHCVATDVTSGAAVLADGPALAPPAGESVGRGPVQRRFPLRLIPGDRDRLCPGAGSPHQLCRRTRLGALRAGRIRRPRLRHRPGGRRRFRPAPRRHAHDEQRPGREGLPPLGPRHRRGGHARGAGLSFAVAWDKPDFIGRDALLRQREQNVQPKRMVAIALADGDEPPLMYHEEPIWRDGEIVGATTSGAWGHRTAKSLALGYVHCPGGVTGEWIDSGGWEIEIAWRRYAARVQFAPFYDPKSERMRG